MTTIFLVTLFRNAMRLARPGASSQSPDGMGTVDGFDEGPVGEDGPGDPCESGPDVSPVPVDPVIPCPEPAPPPPPVPRPEPSENPE